MRGANGAVIGKACTCRYLSISSLRQRPSSRMRSESTSAHSKAMAPLDRSDRMDMSVGRTPVLWARLAAAQRRCWVRMEVVMTSQVEPE
jgi:hypothetical protein